MSDIEARVRQSGSADGVIPEFLNQIEDALAKAGLGIIEVRRVYRPEDPYTLVAEVAIGTDRFSRAGCRPKPAENGEGFSTLPADDRSGHRFEWVRLSRDEK